jgi:hypothetical protein
LNAGTVYLRGIHGLELVALLFPEKKLGFIVDI